MVNLLLANEKKQSKEDCRCLATMISPLWFFPDDRALASAIAARIDERLAPDRDRLNRDVDLLFKPLLSECLDESRLRAWIKDDNNRVALVAYCRGHL